MNAVRGLNLYNIPAGTGFSDALAGRLLAETAGNPEKLTAYRILLPTRRACRNLRETFLRLGRGRPLLLPRLQPLGDIEEDELMLELAGHESAEVMLSLPPALSPLRRRLMLARLVRGVKDFSGSPEQAMTLAGALGHLMDQVYTEGLDLARLPALVEEEKLASHWQITVKFLEILSRTWPEVLAENGVIDAADRRNRLLAALTSYWQAHPPETPVIAAGSTGSIPATARLLQVIATLPQGAVILPGLDQDMDEQSWQALDDSHPQATLQQLLERLDADRTDVRPWPYEPPASAQVDEPQGLTARKQEQRRFIASELMRPAGTAQGWNSLSLAAEERAMTEQSLSGIQLYECENVQEEAAVIALMMRDTLEAPGKTAALVTPDRQLARRVAMACRRWRIAVDDSGGQVLRDTPLGSFLRLAGQTVASRLRPSVFAALLKHKFAQGGLAYEDFRILTEKLEIALLRGPAPAEGFKGLREGLAENPDTELEAFIVRLEEALAPLLQLTQEEGGQQDFAAFLDAHIGVCENLAATPDMEGAGRLWQGDDGEAAALFLSELREQAYLPGSVSAADYMAIMDQLMATVTVRPAYGTHPRLFILGQLEARLIQADLVILGSLNEGIWPPEPPADPWMSRPMRKSFGLPPPERSIGLAAHDFVQGFCVPHIMLTRSRRQDGAPAAPARWLQRLHTVLRALDIKPEVLRAGPYLHWARQLDDTDGAVRPVSRPEPRPPAEKRPQSLSVTAIEQWMRDPYSIYAKHILKLHKLSPLEEKTDAAERGTMMHEVLEEFVRLHPHKLPEDAEDRLITLGREMLGPQLEDPRLWGFWWPRFERLAGWFVRHERIWRQQARPLKTEITGALTLPLPNGGEFTLRAKADRIDLMSDGSAAIIDYKTGTVPAKGDIALGYAPQLPLEGLMVTKGAFEGVHCDTLGYLGFWAMSGGSDPGRDVALKDDLETLAREAGEGLIALAAHFNDPATPYYSLPRLDKAPPAAWQDYAHLARVQEWAALGEESEAA